MNNNKLIDLIDVALIQADRFIDKYYKGDDKPMLGTIKVLTLLRTEIQHNPDNINIRVLRAMQDISAISVKAYENTELETAISNIFSYLFHSIPNFKHLEPLRMDFGQGNPI